MWILVYRVRGGVAGALYRRQGGGAAGSQDNKTINNVQQNRPQSRVLYEIQYQQSRLCYFWWVGGKVSRLDNFTILLVKWDAINMSSPENWADYNWKSGYYEQINSFLNRHFVSCRNWGYYLHSRYHFSCKSISFRPMI